MPFQSNFQEYNICNNTCNRHRFRNGRRILDIWCPLYFNLSYTHNLRSSSYYSFQVVYQLICYFSLRLALQYLVSVFWISLSTHTTSVCTPCVEWRRAVTNGGIVSVFPQCWAWIYSLPLFSSFSSAKLCAPRMEFSFSRGSATWHNVFVLRMGPLLLCACVCVCMREKESALEATDMVDWL